MGRKRFRKSHLESRRARCQRFGTQQIRPDRAFTRVLRVSREHNAVQTAAAVLDLIAQAAPQPADGVAGRLAELACTPMSIQPYADRLGLTAEELREVIRRTTGSTPHELVLSTRLSTAKVLLAEEDLPVAAVALRGDKNMTTGL